MNGRLHLSPNHRGVLEALLREHLPDVVVWAYGSRVNGRSHDDSDLDLALRGPGQKRIPSEQLAAFEDAVGDSAIPFLVDARDWARLPERFRRAVQRDYVALRRPKPPSEDTWPHAPLGSVVTFLSGGTPSKSNPAYWGGSIPWVSAKDMKIFRLSDTKDHITPEGAASGTRTVPKGSVLLLTRGMTLLKSVPVCLLDREMAFNQDVKALRPGPRILPDYLPYLVLGNVVRLKSLVDLAGHGTGRLNSEELKALNVQVAPTNEQRAIAHILGVLDDKIEQNRRINETLEAMARALFKSWFVDFEPVRAKMAQRDTALPNDIAQLFPGVFDHSPLGKVPRGWKVVELPGLIDINPRRPSLQKGESARYVPMSSMPTSGHTPSQVTRRPFGSGTRFINGDTLMARITPSLENGKTAYVDFLEEGQVGWGSTEYIVLRPKPILPPEFAYCLARSSGFRNFAIQSMTGTSGRQRVQPTALGQFLLPCPPRQIGREFGRLIRPLIERARMAANESRTLAEMRDAMLPRLISGEIGVSEASKVVQHGTARDSANA